MNVYKIKFIKIVKVIGTKLKDEIDVIPHDKNNIDSMIHISPATLPIREC